MAQDRAGLTFRTDRITLTPQEATVTRTARIAVLRESIARRALASTLPGCPADVRVLDVRRVADTFIITTENPHDPQARFYVEVFRIPTADNTTYYEPGQAPLLWTPLAGWSTDNAAEIPGLINEATNYAQHDAIPA